MKLHKLSLFGAVVGALIFTTALAPRANATLIVYFNFEDTPGTGGRNAVFDNFADAIAVGPDTGNTGGGTQASTLTLNYNTTDFTTGGGLLLNRSTSNGGDTDPAAPVPPSFFGHALVLNNTGANQGTSLCFTADTTFLTNLALSFAVDNNGNGFDTVELTYQINGGTVVSVGTQPMGLSTQTLVTFSSAQIDPTGTVFTGDGTPQSTEFCLVFTGSNTSSGKNRQTAIDNIQLNAAVVPEPATVASGLLSICGLCWHQRRRLIRSLRLPAA
jgi:hypothetical protein